MRVMRSVTKALQAATSHFFFPNLKLQRSRFFTASRSVSLADETAASKMRRFQAFQMRQSKISKKHPAKLRSGGGRDTPRTRDLPHEKITEDGVLVPLGKPKEEPSKRGCLFYNEYVVYNVDQIKMRYVLHVSFNYERR